MTAHGLPTVKQVGEHAERHGGLWRCRWGFLQFKKLHVRDGQIIVGGNGGVPLHASGWRNATDWTPCDRDGNPLELVQMVAGLREEIRQIGELVGEGLHHEHTYQAVACAVRDRDVARFMAAGWHRLARAFWATRL